MTPTKNRQPYSREVADRMVPLLRRILTDLREAFVELQARVGTLEDAGVLSRLRSDDVPPDMTRTLADLRGYLAELDELQVELVDPELGLVSFPGRHLERQVNFCWKIGEDRVRYWYEAGAGYADRRPFDPVPV